MKTGKVRMAPTKRRRVMSRNSVSLLFADAPAGSSAMPQSGQSPGPFCRICGCIGQVYSASGEAAAGAARGIVDEIDAEVPGRGREGVEVALTVDVDRPRLSGNEVRERALECQ